MTKTYLALTVRYRTVTVLLALGSCMFAAAQESSVPSSHHDMNMHAGMETTHEHHMAPAVGLTFTDLEQTASQLEKARHATEKYRNVNVAEADGYRAIGPDVPGMGIHYVHVAGDRQSGQEPHSAAFDIERPDILLYEKDSSAPSGYALVGVSYLLTANSDTDGQPKNPPFPKALASWHRHSDLCVFPDRTVKGDLSEDQCNAKGGQFTELTQWMIHAWIWKDSPAGVFSPTNPTVQ
jgi:hypothetical protein